MTAQLNVIKNPIGQLKVDGEDKDAFEISYIIKKNGSVIHLSAYEFDHIVEEAKPYIGKSTITE